MTVATGRGFAIQTPDADADALLWALTHAWAVLSQQRSVLEAELGGDFSTAIRKTYEQRIETVCARQRSIERARWQIEHRDDDFGGAR